MKSIKNAAKAIIIENEKLLAIKKKNDQGAFYVLPGGGQELEESLSDALIRECREELGVEIIVGRLVCVRDYIAKNHPATGFEKKRPHKVDFFFSAQMKKKNLQVFSPVEPDSEQVAIEWIPIAKIEEFNVFPQVLRKIIKSNFLLNSGSIYLGDVN